MKKTFKTLIVSICLLTTVSFLHAQTNTFPTTGSAGVGTITPNASSLLDVTSTTKGMLVPRMTLAQRNAIATPATGLLIFQTNTTPGFYYYTGSAWQNVSGANTSLSNLTTTSINLGLLPDSTSFRNLGSATKSWNNLYFTNNIFKAGSKFISAVKNGIFIGTSAGDSLKNGLSNYAIGNSSQTNVTNGDMNVSFGSLALYSNRVGNSNVAIGINALQNNTSNNNTAVGESALLNNKTGSSNTAIGYHADVAAIGLTNATAIGANASVKANNAVVLGYNSNVGIGQSAPAAKLHIQTTSTPLTPTVLLYDDDAANYPRINFQNSSGTNYWTIGGLTNASKTNERFTISEGSTTIMAITGDGKVGIGTTTPAYQLQLSTNSAAKPGSPTWDVVSDANLKSDVKDFTDGLNVINNIHPITYRYNGKANMPTNETFTGTLAQELQKVAPYMVKPWTYKNESGDQSDYLSVDYSAMFFLLTNSIKEQQLQLTEKEKEIRELKDAVTQLQNDMTNSGISSRNLNLKDAARLEQNNPNPFKENTTIRFNIPSNSTSSVIKIFSMNGEEIRSFNIETKGMGKIEIAGNTLSAGVYTYVLMIDEVTVDTRQMVLTK